jgi:hypothetical protein
MSRKYDLDNLLKTPDRPLTMNQWNNFDRYMRMTNDDKSAADVDIEPAINKIANRIRRNKTYWR